MKLEDFSKKLAITISVYNRWDELGGLLELLRLNWKQGKDLYINVISTAGEKEFPDWIDKKMMDSIEFGSPYPMPVNFILSRLAKIKLLAGYINSRQRKIFKPIVRSRITDSIIRGFKKGIESNRKYTMHLFGVSWPLMEDKIYELLDTMEKNGYVFTCRGYGKKLINGKCPWGDMDDNFFVVDNEFAKKTNFWDFDPRIGANKIANEGRLAGRMYELCPQDKIYFYDDFSRSELYLFPEGTSQRRMQPFNYFKPMGLLRSHDKTIRAEFCKRMNFQGPIIKKLIEDNLK